MIRWTERRSTPAWFARAHAKWLWALSALSALALLGCAGGHNRPAAQQPGHSGGGAMALHAEVAAMAPASPNTASVTSSGVTSGMSASAGFGPNEGAAGRVRNLRKRRGSGQSWVRQPGKSAEGRNPARSTTALQEPGLERDSGLETVPSMTDAGTTGPLLIYKANLQIAAFEVEKTLDAIEEKTRELGGYLVSRNDQQVLTVRVPSRHFAAAMRDVQSLGDVVHRNVQVDDVTEKFFDLEIRLKNALAMRDRLEQLLDRATNVSESLIVEKELARIAGDIERLRGQLRLMSELTAYSTISVQVVQVTPRRTTTVNGFQLPFPWLNELGLRDLMRIQ
jgi:hypothetical protein